MELPPPIATSPSQPPRRNAASPSAASRSVGFGWTSSKRAARMPAASRTPYRRAASPARTTPASVTTSGRVTPSRPRWAGSRASAPGPRTMRVGQESSTTGISAGRSKGIMRSSGRRRTRARVRARVRARPFRARARARARSRDRRECETPSHQLEVPLQLPRRHRPLEPAHLPLARADVVIDEALAQDLSRAVGPAQELDRVAQVAGKRRSIGGVAVPLAGGGRLHLVLDPPQPGGERGRHRYVGVHVRARLPVLDPRRLWRAADEADGAGPVLPTPRRGRRSPSVLDAPLVAVHGGPVERGQLRHERDLAAEVVAQGRARAAGRGAIVEAVLLAREVPERLVHVAGAAGQRRVPLRHEAGGEPVPRADLLHRGLEERGLVGGALEIVVEDRRLV